MILAVLWFSAQKHWPLLPLQMFHPAGFFRDGCSLSVIPSLRLVDFIGEQWSLLFLQDQALVSEWCDCAIWVHFWVADVLLPGWIYCLLIGCIFCWDVLVLFEFISVVFDLCPESTIFLADLLILLKHDLILSVFWVNLTLKSAY